jgi:hypothetical protein
MSDLNSFLASVIDSALSTLTQEAFPLYTFAFYNDHESSAVSVCADTMANSTRVVGEINRYNLKYFSKAVQAGRLDEAALWQANVGRSLSLGDFARKNLCRSDLPDLAADTNLHHAMVLAVFDRAADLARLAPEPAQLLLACSTADDEVGLVWSVSVQTV